jgi:MFS family permease
MIATLRQRNFALLWTAGLISYIGDWVLLTVLPVFVYERTNSTLASGMVLMMYALATLLVGSIAGVFVDRWDRRRALIKVNLLQAALIPFLLLALRDEWLWVVYPVAFLEGSLYAFLYPAENALLPRLVGEDRLLTANALNSLNDNLARIIGPAIGGVILAQANLAAAVLVDAVSYLLAALLIAGITVSGRAVTPSSGDEALETQAERSWIRVWREWVEGLRLIRTTPPLRGLFLVIAIAALADSLNTPLIAPFVLNVVGAGAAAIGLIFTVRGVAGLLGGLLIARFASRFDPVRLLGWSRVVYGLGYLIIVNLPILPVIVAVQLALAPAIIAWSTSQQTLLQSRTEDRFRGRIFGAVDTTIALMGIVGIGIGSALGDVVGIVPLYNLSALLYAAAGLVALRYLRGVVSPHSATGDRVTAV